MCVIVFFSYVSAPKDDRKRIFTVIVLIEICGLIYYPWCLVFLDSCFDDLFTELNLYKFSIGVLIFKLTFVLHDLDLNLDIHQFILINFTHQNY